MYLVAVALSAAFSLVDISGAQSCVGRDGQVNPKSECGDCTVKGDPHITTYDTHTLINPPTLITSYIATDGFGDKYALSQKGICYHPLFGVDATFRKGGAIGWKKNASFVSSVTYNEPGITVELILPPKADTKLSDDPITFYCQKEYQQGIGFPPPPGPNDPQCATKINVKGRPTVIPVGRVSIFRGTAGSVGIFKVGDCNSYKCHIIVEGSQGITVSLKIDPDLEIGGKEWIYHLNVYAKPSLRGPNTLFGLCDTFTRTGTNHYTPRYGQVITSEANLKQFIETWKVPKISSGNTAPCAPTAISPITTPTASIATTAGFPQFPQYQPVDFSGPGFPGPVFGPQPIQISSNTNLQQPIPIRSSPNIKLVGPSGVITGSVLRNLAKQGFKRPQRVGK